MCGVCAGVCDTCCAHIHSFGSEELSNILCSPPNKGQNLSKDGTLVENVSGSLETGLLNVLKKAIMLMPDSFVPKVLGVVQYDSLVAIARNPSSFVRTALVGVRSHDLIT